MRTKIKASFTQKGDDDLSGLMWDEGWLAGGVNEKRRKLRIGWGKRLRWCFCTNDVIDGVLSGYCLSLPRGLKHDFLSMAGSVGLHQASPTASLRICRTVAKDAFTYGYHMFGSLWRYLVDLDMLFGSSTQGGTDAEIAAELKDWVSSSTKWKGDVVNEMFDTGMVEVAARMRLSAATLRIERRGADDFHKWPSEWVSSGASSSDGLPGVRSSKVSTFLRWAHEIPAYLRTGRRKWPDAPSRNGLLRKRERKKVRATAKASWTSFVDQSFCLQGVERIVGDALRTTVGAKDEVKLWHDLESDVRKFFPLPIDIPSFDHRPTSRMVLAAARLLMEVCDDGSVEMHNSRERVIKQIVEGYVTDGKVQFAWKGGVLSGWRMTSVLDTVINACLAFGTKIPMSADPATTGDDAMFFMADKDDAESLIDVYDAVGIHRRKFYRDGERSEFMRYLMVKGTRCRVGYPARAWAGYVFTQAFSGGGVATVMEFVDDYERLVQRGLDHREMYNQCVARVSDHLGVGYAEASRFLHTPASVGGGGQRPYTMSWRAVTRDGEVTTTASGAVVRVTPWGELPSDTRAAVERCASRLGLKTDHLSSVAGGLALSKDKSSGREYLKKMPCSADFWFLPEIEEEAVQRPKLNLDGWYASSWVRSRPKRWVDLVTPHEADSLKRLEARIGRGRFINWLLGGEELVKVRGTSFGMLDTKDMRKKVHNWVPRWSARNGSQEWWGRIVSTERRIAARATAMLLG